MIRCVIRGCQGGIREETTAAGEYRYVCDVCGAGPSGAARKEIQDALRRIQEIRSELKRLEVRLGRRSSRNRGTGDE